MFAIALLILGTIGTVLVWIVGLVKLICTFNDNALIAIQYGGPLLLLVSGIVAFKGDPATAGNLLYWTAVIVVGVLPRPLGHRGRPPLSQKLAAAPHCRQRHQLRRRHCRRAWLKGNHYVSP